MAETAIAVNTTGLGALDQALAWAVRENDSATGIGLIRVLGQNSSTPTASLGAALTSSDGALRGEAAVALGEIALRSRSAPTQAVVLGLGEAAGREIMRIGIVIDGDESRGHALADALAAKGVVVNFWNTGAKGLALIKRAPGVDVIVVADNLPDLSVDQVIDEIRRDERTAETPLVMISDSDSDTYADRVNAILAPGGDLGVIEEAMADSLDGDRARADLLAAQAASTLANLARSGAHVGEALAALTGSLAARPDAVCIPAMAALGAAGGATEAAALAAVLSDEARSNAAREAAAGALAQVAARAALSGPPELLEGLGAVVRSGSSLGVRVAASRAISNMSIDDATRAAITQGARVNISQ